MASLEGWSFTTKLHPRVFTPVRRARAAAGVSPAHRSRSRRRHAPAATRPSGDPLPHFPATRTTASPLSRRRVASRVASAASHRRARAHFERLRFAAIDLPEESPRNSKRDPWREARSGGALPPAGSSGGFPRHPSGRTAGSPLLNRSADDISSHSDGIGGGEEWGREDSNLRSIAHQIYSLAPLTTREHPPNLRAGPTPSPTGWKPGRGGAAQPGSGRARSPEW